MHPGGVLHAALHGCGTLLCLCTFTTVQLAFLCAIIDTIAHYSIDWCKVNLNSLLRLTPQVERFWWLLGIDQLLHYLTYASLLFVIV